MASSMAAALAASQAAAAPVPAAPVQPAQEVIPASWAKLVDSEAEITLRVVQLDGLAVMKIMKHSRDAYPSAVNGILLGLDLDGVMEVSNCFPLPAGREGEEESVRPSSKYQASMLRALKEVHGDDNVVGFYQSTAMGAFLSQSFLDLQASHQKSLRHGGIALVHDVSRTARGNTSLKAFRLTQAFLGAHKARKFNVQGLIERGLTFNNILEELPLQIHNTPLLDAFLLTLAQPTVPHTPASLYPTSSLSDLPPTNQPLTPTYPILNTASTPALTHNLSLVLDTLDDYNQESSNYAYHQRQIAREKTRAEAYTAKRKEENAQRVREGLPPLPEEDVSRLFKIPPEPSRLESMLLLGQLDGYSKTLEDVTGASMVKIYAAKAGATAA
ncbi:translation initiation factor 3 subunit 3 [Calocera cornea HHB12733]|uniref:Eukaryotic translation initiation factor 3 subunit H n=1 Tax=Calocera cornea HHB12733 TaxID=1353952 RepID=A0A165FQ83_9BASI|nr:translation initiation factor 3 subunit 3 [Calocera cornea HHB12733]